MHIYLRKISDDRHALTIVRDDGRTDSVECETRSHLLHDLLHHAVEAEAGLDGGFWGSLAGGKTLAELNDKTPMEQGGQMLMIEQIVGAMSGVTKGVSGEAIVAGLCRNADALSWTIPTWLTPSFVTAVQERMRRLVGQWKATAYGESMELRWPAP
jgi:hypothetical protein